MVAQLTQDPASDNGWAGVSSNKAQPTELLRSHSGKSCFGECQLSSILYQRSQSWDSDKGNVKESTLIRHTVRKRRAKTESQPKTRTKPDLQNQLIGIKPKAKTQLGQEDLSKSKVKAHSRNVKGAKTETEKEVPKSEETAKHFRQEDLDNAGSKMMSADKRQQGASEQKREELPREVFARITQGKHIPAESDIKVVEVKSKPIIVLSKLLDNTIEHDANEWNGSTSSEKYNQTQVPTKKTQSTKTEHKMDTLKKSKGLVVDFTAAHSLTETIRSQSENTLPSSLMGVTLITEDLPTESPVHLLKYVASCYFLAQAASVNSSQANGQSPNTLDEQTLLNAASISEDTEKNTSKRTTITINVMHVPATSDEETERSMSQYQSEEKIEEEDESKGMTDSERLAKERQKSSSVEYAKKGSKCIGQVASDDGEEQDDTICRVSNEDEESEGEVKEETRKTESEQGKESETESEEECNSHIMEEREDEYVSKIQNAVQVEEESRMSYGEEESRKESESLSSEPEEEEGEEESKSSKSESEGDESEEEEVAEDERNHSEEEKVSVRKEKNETEGKEKSVAEEDTTDGEEEQESGMEELESEQGGNMSEIEDENEDGDKSEAGVEEREEEESETGNDKSEDEEEESEAVNGETEEEEEENEEVEEEGKGEKDDREEEEEESEAGKEESTEEEEEDGEEEESVTGKEENEEEESIAGNEKSGKEEEENEADKEESGEEVEENEEGEEESEAEEEDHEEEEERTEREAENEEDSEGEEIESGDREEESGDEEVDEDIEAEKDIEESEQENDDKDSEAGKAGDSEDEKEEEEGGEQAGEDEGEEEVGAQEDEDEEENEEKEAAEEEEPKKKRKGNEKSSFISKQPKSKQEVSKRKKGSARKCQSISESQEPRQFWDDVLPQYLNLK